MQVLSRRSVLQGSAVVVIAGIAGFAVARNSSAANAKGATTAANGYGASTQSSGRKLIGLDKVPENGGVILTADKIVITRGAGGTVHGFSAVCTHQGCTVSSVANGVISCPCHGSRFDAQNGNVLAGPAPRPLPKVAVVVRGGEVYAE